MDRKIKEKILKKYQKESKEVNLEIKYLTIKGKALDGIVKKITAELKEKDKLEAK